MKQLSLLLALLCLTTTAFARGARVNVLDTKGRVIYSATTIALSKTSVGVPIEAFAKVGMFTRLEVSKKRAFVGLHNSDSGLIFRSGSPQVLDFFSEKPKGKRYPAPIALLRGGKFYVAVGVVAAYYSDAFGLKRIGGTLILQSRGLGPVPDGGLDDGAEPG